MKRLFFFFIFLMSFIAQATEYDSISLKTGPAHLRSTFIDIFSKNELWSLSPNEFPTIGINQIFLERNSNGYVTIKFDVTGDFKIDEAETLNGGTLIHLSINSKNIAFYFKDVPDWKVNNIISTIKDTNFQKTSFQSFTLIPSAHAVECGIPLNGSVTKSSAYATMSKISIGEISNGLMSCLNGLGSGAKDSLVAIPEMAIGAVKAIGKEALAFWENPTGRAKAYYNAVDGVITGVKNFIVLTAECLMNPSKGIALMKEKLGEAGAYFGKLFTSLSTMPAEMAIEFICSFVGGIGMDAVMAAFTGGAGVGKLLLTLKRTLKSMDKLADFMKVAKKVKSFSKLGLDKAFQTKLFKKIHSGEVDLKRLETFNASLTTNSQLVKKYALRGLQCSL